MQNKQLKILAIAGSLREGSFNKMLIGNAVELLPDGVEMEVYDLASLPLFNQDYELDPSGIVTEFKQKIRLADGILIATPEYNYSTSGVLKNAIDCASRPHGDSAWEGKPIALMGASISGFGTVRAQMHLRQSFLYLGAQLVQAPEVYISTAGEKFDEFGSLKNSEDKEKIRQLLRELTNLIIRNKACF